MSSSGVSRIPKAMGAEHPGGTMDPILQGIWAGVVAGDRAAVAEGVQAALRGGVAAEDILHSGLVPAMGEVGSRFERGDYFVPEMMVAARAMKAGLALLRPGLVARHIAPRGVVVIGTVHGDLHDIGKSLVAMMLEGSGFEVIDLGTDVPPERFAQVAMEVNANVVGLSALLTTTMQNMRSTVGAIEDAGLRPRIRIMVGGAPVTEAFAKEIAADGYAPDANSATVLAHRLLG